MKAFSLRMPVRFLRGSYTRLTLMVVALACGVALVCAIDLVNRAVLRAFVEVVDTMAGRAALQVTAGESGLFAEEVADTVAGIPGVALAVPVVSATAFTTDGSGELLTVQGIDITNDDAVRVYDARDEAGLELEDPLVVLSQPDSIILTRAFARRHSLAVGSSLELTTPGGRRSFTIRGLLEPQGVACVFGGNLVVMDIYAAEAAFARPHFVNRVDVVASPEADVSRISDAIAAALPDLKVETPKQRKVDINKIVGSLQILLGAMGLVGLVVAFLIAFNRLSTFFESRIWQVGILRAVGLRTGAVWRELIKESLLIGAAGVALGIPFGIALGHLLLPVIATTTALSYKLVGHDATFSLSMSSLTLAATLGMAAAVIAAAMPAGRTARLTVVAILRGRGIEEPESAGRARIYTGLALLVSVALALGLQSATRSPTWGLLATALIIVEAALTARPIVGLLRSPLTPLLRWFGGPAGRFAASVVSHNPRRTALTVATLGVGLGAVVWLWVVARSFERSVIDVLTPAFQSDLIVSSSHVESGAFDAPVDEQLERELKTIGDVAAVAAERVTDWHYEGGPLIIEAFDPDYFSDPSFGRWPLVGPRLQDAWGRVSRGEAVVVSSSLQRAFNQQVGSKLVLETPHGALTLPIAAVTMDFASPRGTVKISRSVYKRYWDDNDITLALVQVREGADVAQVRAAIAAELGGKYELRILSSGELVGYYARQVRRAFSTVHALAGLVLVVILVGVADTLAAAVVERTRELGAMRAVGVPRRQLQRMVIAEGMALALMGSVLSVATGLMLGTLWVRTTFPYLLGWVLELHIPYVQVAVGVAATIMVCLAAAVLPARRAARLEPAVALRYE